MISAQKKGVKKGAKKGVFYGFLTRIYGVVTRRVPYTFRTVTYKKGSKKGKNH